MQRGLATRKLSVCPSVKRVICDKTKQSYAHILIPHERRFILVLWQVESVNICWSYCKNSTARF